MAIQSRLKSMLKRGLLSFGSQFEKQFETWFQKGGLRRLKCAAIDAVRDAMLEAFMKPVDATQGIEGEWLVGFSDG
jgi:hypothetical protein